jgi:hypothetical protein
MIRLPRLLCGALIGLFQSSARREAEILVLRHQINVLRRKSPKRSALNNADRLLFVWLSRLVPSTLAALAVVRPETVIRWHRAGFRAYWRSRSRPRGGRPKTPLEIRQLIRDMSIANPLWGAPRIHGEFLKLGIDVGQKPAAYDLLKWWGHKAAVTNTLRPLGVTLTPKPGEAASQYKTSDLGIGSASMALLVSLMRGM